jgi:hypothetical protein
VNAVYQSDPTLPADLGRLPADALLTRRQLEQITGFRSQTFKNWAAAGRGPRITTIEKRPRYRAADVRDWLSGRETSGSPGGETGLSSGRSRE